MNEPNDLPTITGQEIADHGGHHGDLLSVRILDIPERPGELALEFRTGGRGHGESRHLVLTNARQALRLAAQIRRTLLPEFEGEVLAALDRIEKR